MSINSAGVIVGEYIDARGVSHGFVRAPDGIIATFDALGVGSSSQGGTLPVTINEAGAITGVYVKGGYYGQQVAHGFLAIPASMSPLAVSSTK